MSSKSKGLQRCRPFFHSAFVLQLTALFYNFQIIHAETFKHVRDAQIQQIPLSQQPLSIFLEFVMHSVGR